MSSASRRERWEAKILATLDRFGPLTFAAVRGALPNLTASDRWVWARFHSLRDQGLIREDEVQRKWHTT